MGGTEILVGKLRRYVDPRLLNAVNLIISHTTADALRPGSPNILWHHLDVNQENSTGLGEPSFVSALDKIIFVSNWQMEEHIQVFNLPREKCTVLHNAIDPVEMPTRKPANKLRLIYTSTPWRGLEVLVECFKALNSRHIELDVYSSTVIYGTGYLTNKFEWLFDRCRNTPGINYRGYASNKAVLKTCIEANIFAYPSIFRETSCLAAIEAGASGLGLVTTNYGALSETCGQWGKYVEVDTSLVANFTDLLSKEIDSYWSNQDYYTEQSGWFNSRYSWIDRAVQWTELLENYA